MDVYVNDQPLTAEIADAGTVRRLAEIVSASNPDLMIVAIALDGRAVDDETIEAVMATPLSNPGRLDLTVESSAKLAAEAVGAAADGLARTRGHHVRIAELLAGGAAGEAMELLNECFSVWNTAEQSLRKAAQACGLDLSAPLHDGVRPEAMIEALRTVLADIQRNLQAKDFVAVADVVEYDMAAVSDDWRGMLVGVQHKLLD